MPAPQSLDELIARKAAEFADQLRAVAAMADKEEEIRIATERQLAFIEREAGIELEGRHEFTVAKGRIDSVYSRVVIEYKNPSSAAARIGPKADSPGSKKVVEQIKSRFRALRDEHGHKVQTLFGVGFDGKHFIFVRYRDDKWDVQEPVEVTRHSAERFLWALFNLGQKGKPFSPEYLAGDFGAQEGSLATAGVRALYEAIVGTDHPKAQTFFSQWKILFGEVCGYDVDNPSDKIKKLAAAYGVPAKGLRPAELLFALHTYYAIFMKLLAAEIVAFFHRLPTPLERMIQSGTSAKLKRELEELEAGGIFRHLNITNFLEGDLFAWYTSVWSEPIEKLVRAMVTRLDDYNPGTLSEDPAVSRDLLKKLYQQLFPKSVRHDLGEYYTPDWLAEHVLNELAYVGDPDKRLLDPACGSGTFLVMAIRRIRAWFEENRERCSFDEGELCGKILANVVGFDLNPIAVMAARTNYLIAIRDLIAHLGKVEIPVYLCDSIVTPAEYGDLFIGPGAVARVPCSACRPPHLAVPKEIAQNSDHVARYAAVIDESLRARRTAAEFVAACVDDSLPLTNAEVHANLYAEILALEREGKNGIWARIIKNAFAPLFIGRFDYVAGNPPWVNWEHLPPEYREISEDIWREYKLTGPFPFKKRQQSDKAKTDISILMTYVAADKYLIPNGRLGFVITRTVFQAELGGWHFRRFKLPKDKSIRIDAVHDLDAVKPFRGQAANTTSTVMMTVGHATTYPVRWMRYLPKDDRGIEEDTSYSEAIARMECTSWVARPINNMEPQSPWLFGDERAVKALFRVIERSFYAPLAREGVNTRGANGVFFLDAELLRGQLLVRNRPQDGKDSALPQVQVSIEPAYIFPLLRGKDVSRWVARPSSYVLVPHAAAEPANPVPFSKLPNRTREFLTTFEDKLRSRKKFRNFDPSGQLWHGMYSVLNASFAPFKVVWREMATGAIAAIVGNSELPDGQEKVVIPDHKLFIIPCKSLAEAFFVCGIFNSSISNYLILSYAIATGISTHVLDRLPIAHFDEKHPLHRAVASAAQACHASATRGHRVADKLLDDLDKAVAALLEMSDSDLRAIRKGLREISSVGCAS